MNHRQMNVTSFILMLLIWIFPLPLSLATAIAFRPVIIVLLIGLYIALWILPTFAQDNKATKQLKHFKFFATFGLILHLWFIGFLSDLFRLFGL